MRAAVAAAFLPFTTPLEGATTWPYLDVLCLVTTGYGNRIDPIDQALGLEWVHASNGAPMSKAEVIAGWNTVKAATVLAPQGGGHFEHLTDMRLTPAALSRLFQGRLAGNDAFLASRFHGYAMWPADAQLGTLSIAWAAGPAWTAPRFATAVSRLRFDLCAGSPGDAGADYAREKKDAVYLAECATHRGEAWLNDSAIGGTLRTRNLLNKALFEAAAKVAACADGSLDPEKLYGWVPRI
jgi:hypothetical protein